MRIIISVLSIFFITSISAHAATIEFSKDELAKESVLPVFEGKTLAVQSRRVVTDGKIEFGLGASFIFNEPFFETMAYRLQAGYHLNNFSSIHANFVLRQADPSSDAEEIDGGSTAIRFDLAPVPEYMATIDYQLTPYYGKISFTKEGVMNMAFYGVAGLGGIDVGGEVRVLANLGVGTNLYVTPRIAIKADLRFYMYNAPNVLSNGPLTPPAKDPSEFDDDFQISPTAFAGVSFLL